MLENNLIEFSNDDTPHYIGHRKRVKKRFVAARAEHFSDYELLEVMLFSAIPRKDVKPLAKKLLDHFDITDLIKYAELNLPIPEASLRGIDGKFSFGPSCFDANNRGKPRGI